MQRRLIVGCGQFHVKEPGDHTLDILPFPDVDTVHDLNYDLPFEDDEFDYMVAIHVVEHLQSLIHFMNEAWRVLKPGGELYIETPLAGANNELEFADPTHIRCYTTYSFHNYFTLSGVHNFGYTDKPWSIITCHSVPINPLKSDHPDVLVFHGYPLK